MGTDRLRAKLTTAGYDEAQVVDMGRTELSEAMAEAMLDEDLTQEASQVCSIASQVETEVVH